MLACREDAQGATDGVPVALMEPMAAGRPVVSTSIAGIPELIVDGVTGYLALPGNPRSLADTIGRILDAPVPPIAVVRRARAHIEADFDCEGEARKLATLIGVAAGGRATGGLSRGRAKRDA